MDEDKFLTVRQVATFFAVTQYTVREWLKDGQLTGIKIGERWRIRQSEVTRFANEQYGAKQ